MLSIPKNKLSDTIPHDLSDYIQYAEAYLVQEGLHTFHLVDYKDGIRIKTSNDINKVLNEKPRRISALELDRKLSAFLRPLQVDKIIGNLTLRCDICGDDGELHEFFDKATHSEILKCSKCISKSETPKLRIVKDFL